MGKETEGAATWAFLICIAAPIHQEQAAAERRRTDAAASAAAMARRDAHFHQIEAAFADDPLVSIPSRK